MSDSLARCWWTRKSQAWSNPTITRRLVSLCALWFDNVHGAYHLYWFVRTWKLRIAFQSVLQHAYLLYRNRYNSWLKRFRKSVNQASYLYLLYSHKKHHLWEQRHCIWRTLCGVPYVFCAPLFALRWALQDQRLCENLASRLSVMIFHRWRILGKFLRSQATFQTHPIPLSPCFPNLWKLTITLVRHILD